MTRVQPLNAFMASENQETSNPRSILQVLNPVITWMRVCGVCIGPRVTMENIRCSDYRFRRLHKDGWFHILYCALINCYLWTYTGILAYKLTLLVTMSSEWITVFQLLVLNLTASGCSAWTSLNYRGGIYQIWVKEFYLYEQRYGVHENMKVMVKKSRMLLALVMSTGICIPGAILTTALLVPEIGETVFVVDRALGWWNYLITTINYFIFYTALSSCVVSSVIGSYPLCSELDVINTIIKRCVDESIKRQECQTFRSKSISDITEELKTTMSRYKRIACLIYGYSDVIVPFQFTVFFMSLPLSCFSLYVIMTRTELPSNVALCIYIMLLCSVSCIVLSFAGMKVNVKAHNALQYMIKIPTDNLSETTMRAVTHFTSLLTGTTIGYNVHGLFTISPPTVLSIVGTLVTYIVVVLQFRTSDCRTSSDTLCQDLVTNVTSLLEVMRNATSRC
ncbi:uncharacterized protein [Haliotis asinina]|uniref:uncharacterized protein n=1 Tax=Haliotis asinina TaxID=109174 RepID=UPI003532350C